MQDFARLVDFYRSALAPIGYGIMMEVPGAVGMGAEMPYLWLTQTDQPLNPTHFAIGAETREAIDAFYAAALAAGGTDNGPPGLRLHNHPTYYAAFVRDPEGNNIEVVCHAAPGAPRAAKAKARKARKPAKKAKAAARKPAKKAKPAKKKRR